MLKNNCHLLHGEISYDNIARAVQWIISENLKKYESGKEPKVLTLYINSNGGDLYNAFALVDVMHASKIPVSTVGIGNVMSAAALILACGSKGKRYVAKHAGVLMHQFSTDMGGKEHELQAGMLELNLCRGRVNNLLTGYCKIGKTILKKNLMRPSDAWLTAEEAVKYKLADKIFTTFKEG